MKFLTIAAICALASSVSSFTISRHLADPTAATQDLQKDHPQENGNHGHGHGHGHGDKKDKKDSNKGGNKFDWKTWTNPCPNKDDKACWKQYFSTQLACKADDKQCWGDSLNKLPCPLGNKMCWTQHIDTFPCKKQDQACWN